MSAYPSPEGGGWRAKRAGWGVLVIGPRAHPTRLLADARSYPPRRAGRDKQGLRHDRVGLDLDQPGRIDCLHDLDHGRGGTDVLEEFAMRAPGVLPIAHVLEKHSRAHNVLALAAGLIHGLL